MCQFTQYVHRPCMHAAGAPFVSEICEHECYLQRSQGQLRDETAAPTGRPLPSFRIPRSKVTSLFLKSKCPNCQRAMHRIHDPFDVSHGFVYSNQERLADNLHWYVTPIPTTDAHFREIHWNKGRTSPPESPSISPSTVRPAIPKSDLTHIPRQGRLRSVDARKSLVPSPLHSTGQTFLSRARPLDSMETTRSRNADEVRPIKFSNQRARRRAVNLLINRSRRRDLHIRNTSAILDRRASPSQPPAMVPQTQAESPMLDLQRQQPTSAQSTRNSISDAVDLDSVPRPLGSLPIPSIQSPTLEVQPLFHQRRSTPKEPPTTNLLTRASRLHKPLTSKLKQTVKTCWTGLLTKIDNCISPYLRQWPSILVVCFLFLFLDAVSDPFVG